MVYLVDQILQVYYISVSAETTSFLRIWAIAHSKVFFFGRPWKPWFHLKLPLCFSHYRPKSFSWSCNTYIPMTTPPSIALLLTHLLSAIEEKIWNPSVRSQKRCTSQQPPLLYRSIVVFAKNEFSLSEISIDSLLNHSSRYLKIAREINFEAEFNKILYHRCHDIDFFDDEDHLTSEGRSETANRGYELPSCKRKRADMNELSDLVSASSTTQFPLFCFFQSKYQTGKFFQWVWKVSSHQIQRLQEEYHALRDELHKEKERHRKTQVDLSQELEKRSMKCSICYIQPDRWITLTCQHMFCESCIERLEWPKQCPHCRGPIKGYWNACHLQDNMRIARCGSSWTNKDSFKSFEAAGWPKRHGDARHFPPKLTAKLLVEKRVTTYSQWIVWNWETIINIGPEWSLLCGCFIFRNLSFMHTGSTSSLIGMQVTRGGIQYFGNCSMKPLNSYH